jgi:hypothetical protein
VWSVYDAGTTGATTNDNYLNKLGAGTAVLRATIIDGLEVGTHYTQNFNVTVIQPVERIDNVPSSALIESTAIVLPLNGTVFPSNATNQSIVWSIADVGTTGATLSGDTLTITDDGDVFVRATIANGRAVGTPWTDTFEIAIIRRVTKH